MNEFIKGIINADGEQWFGFFIFSFIAGIVIITLVAITADHKVRCYYPETMSTVGGLAYRVKADVNWMADPTAFSSFNKDDMMEFINTVKECTDD